MLTFFLHLIGLVLAGIALFVLWRKTISPDALTNFAIAAGFAVRALLGQALFWISWARLPFGRSLQVGQGFWFFAMDAISQYFPQALQGAHQGFSAIIHYERGMASVSFVQLLSVALLLFGEEPSTGLLLNLFCFLGSSYLIVRWADGRLHARVAARVAIMAIALSPALILWSLQPLKDTFFSFLVVALIAACAAWERSWSSESSFGRRVGIAAAIWIATYLLGGLRWYFTLMILIGLSVFALLVAIRATHRKAIAIASCLLLVFVASRAFLLGSGPYVPPSIVGLLTFSRPKISSVAPSAVLDSVESARASFEHAGGATQIITRGQREALHRAAAGDVTNGASRPERSEGDPRPALMDGRVAVLGPPVPKAAAVPASPPAAPVTSDSATPSVSAASAEPIVVQAVPSGKTEQPPPMGVAEAPSKTFSNESPPDNQNGPQQAAVPRSAPERQSAKSGTTPTTPTVSIAPTPSPDRSAAAISPAPAATPPDVSPPAVEGQSPSDDRSLKLKAERLTAVPSETFSNKSPSDSQNAPPRVAVRRSAPERHSAKNGTKPTTPTVSIVPTASPDRSTSTISPAPAATPPGLSRPAVEGQSPSDDRSFRLKAERLAAGAVAMVLPRYLGQRIGLYEIGGGKNLWWFSDLDTIVFDVVLLFAFVWLLRSLRSPSLSSSTFWFVVGLTLLVSVPLAYTVTNFGTLFRLREMIYIGALLIPLALATSQQRQTDAASAPGHQITGTDYSDEVDGTPSKESRRERQRLASSE
jgi:hypothetical protein